MDTKDLKIWILHLTLYYMLTSVYVTSYPLSPIPGRGITPVGPKCPYRCMCQNTQIFCNGVMLRSVPQDIPITTTYLNLRGNIIKQLSMNSTFPNLFKLQGLLLGGNKIAHIDDGVLMKMRQLMMLDLSKNLLEKVTVNTFHGARYLWTLSLSTNHLEKIGDALEDLRALSILNLANNKLKEIHENDFKHNIKLKLLDLSKNKIKFIHPGAFKDLPNLQYLILKLNPLVGMSYLRFSPSSKLALADFTSCGLRVIIGGLPRSMKELRFSKNNLTSVARTDFMQNSSLKTLKIDENQIASIDGNVFERLPKLQQLFLSYNRLIHLPNNISPSTEDLRLDNNHIHNMESGNFKNNANLKFLHLEHNNITDICHDTFSGLTNLISLDLGANYISDIQKCSFENLPNLEKLDLSRNPLRKIGPECFEPLSKLRTLQMSYVSTETRLYSDIFRGIHTLQYLDLYNSSSIAQGIVKSAHYLDSLYSVMDLNLMFDGLETLPKFFPSYFPHVQVVKLSGNPWRCDADILTLRDWIRNYTNVNFPLGNDIQCKTPEWMQGKAIYDVDENVDFDEEKNVLPDDYYYYDEEDYREAVAQENKEREEAKKKSEAGKDTSTNKQTLGQENSIKHDETSESAINERNDIEENITEETSHKETKKDADNIINDENITEQPLVTPKHVNGKTMIQVDISKAETIKRIDGRVEKERSFRIKGFKVTVKSSESDRVKAPEQDQQNKHYEKDIEKVSNKEVITTKETPTDTFKTETKKDSLDYEKDVKKVSNKDVTTTANNIKTETRPTNPINYKKDVKKVSNQEVITTKETPANNFKTETRPKNPNVAIKVGIKVTQGNKRRKPNINSYVRYINDDRNRYDNKARYKITTAPRKITQSKTPTKITTTTPRMTTQRITTPRTIVTPKTMRKTYDRYNRGDEDIEFIEDNTSTTVPLENTNNGMNGDINNNDVKKRRVKVDEESSTAEDDFDAEPGESTDYSGAGHL